MVKSAGVNQKGNGGGGEVLLVSDIKPHRPSRITQHICWYIVRENTLCGLASRDYILPFSLFQEVSMAVITIIYELGQRITLLLLPSQYSSRRAYTYRTASLLQFRPYTEHTRLYNNRSLSAHDYVTYSLFHTARKPPDANT